MVFTMYGTETRVNNGYHASVRDESSETKNKLNTRNNNM